MDKVDENTLQVIKSLYIESRYPTDIALLDGEVLPSIEEAKSYLNFAQNIANIVKSEIEGDKENSIQTY
ncbi:MAG: hypothetical protein LBU89_15090 [Fibromonadaceae bacterium]|nr:hypothetical protein [Fibromonadaceae bacterium]